MGKNTELLAPAGGFEQLRAAVENGADAVYIGGKEFNARINADNFSESELVEALAYAHVRGVNIYIAMNTLVGDSEIGAALAYAGKLYLMGADALILQDIGFAGLVRRYLPGMPIHFSTQGTIFNIEGVRAAGRMGFERVILARELGIEEIREICNQTDMQIEVFVHGALCFCYSGQCEMSHVIGGRSGNRGTCAQPCRLPYSLVRMEKSGKETELERDAYVMSPKDLAAVSLIGDLADAGVASMKIEGRMKSAEYVATVTRIYRKYLDLHTAKVKESHGIYNVRITPEAADEKELGQIFSRGGFTTGYLEGNPGKGLLSGDLPKHQGIRLGTVKSVNREKRLVDIILDEKLSIGDGIEIMSRELPGNIVTFININGVKASAGAAGDVATVGYIDGKITPGDRVNKISDKEQLKAAQASYSGKQARRVGLTGTFILEKGRVAKLTLADGDGHTTEVEGTLPSQEAVNLPLTAEMAEGQLSKTGGTPFYLERCEMSIDPGVSLPISEINLLRRTALERMETLRKIKFPDRRMPEGMPADIAAGLPGKAGKASEKTGSGKGSEIEGSGEMKKCLYFYRLGEMENGLVNSAFEQELFDAARVYLPYDCFLTDRYDDIFRDYKKNGVELVPVIPAITKGYHDEMLRKRLGQLGDHPFANGICVGNPGWAMRCADAGMMVFGDYSLNLYNSFSFLQVKGWGLSGAVVSHEIPPEQALRMDFHGVSAEYAIYGRIPVMVSEHCLAGDRKTVGVSTAKCAECRNANFHIKDRKGERYPVLTDRTSCRMTVLSFARRNETYAVPNLLRAGIYRFRMYIYNESAEDIKQL